MSQQLSEFRLLCSLLQVLHVSAPILMLTLGISPNLLGTLMVFCQCVLFLCSQSVFVCVMVFCKCVVLSQHFYTTGHNIAFEQTKTIATITNTSERKIRETIELRKRPNCLTNRKESKNLNVTLL